MFLGEPLPPTIKPRRFRALGTAVAALGHLLPEGSGHCRVLPRMPGLCPRPAPSARVSLVHTDHRHHTPLADRFLQVVLSTWGLMVSRHVYIILMFVTVRVLRGFVFFALLPFCTSLTRTRHRELLLRSGPTPQSTCFGHGFHPSKTIACYLFPDFKNQLDFARIAYSLRPLS